MLELVFCTVSVREPSEFRLSVSVVLSPPLFPVMDVPVELPSLLTLVVAVSVGTELLLLVNVTVSPEAVSVTFCVAAPVLVNEFPKEVSEFWKAVFAALESESNSAAEAPGIPIISLNTGLIY